jgi:plasmid stability protein
MPDLLIENVDEDLIRLFELHARLNGTSVEHEAHQALIRGLGMDGAAAASPRDIGDPSPDPGEP